MDEKLYSVRLVRPFAGGQSSIVVVVQAVSRAQAQRRAEVELPGWRVVTEGHLTGG